MKLILESQCTDGYTYSCTDYIPFEYESKEKFVFDILEKYKDKEWITYGDNYYSYPESVELIPGVYMTKFDIEQIEHYVYTIEEWFDKCKIIINI